MSPTLRSGDVIFVNELAYSRFALARIVGLSSTPARNDVVVFHSPDSDEVAPVEIKRIVGLPGDTLVMRKGMLVVNGASAFAPKYDASYGTSGDFEDAEFVWQKQYAIHGSRFGEPPSYATLDDWGPLVVAREHYFVLGDNRHFSRDSRFFGVLPAPLLLGKAEVVYLSATTPRLAGTALGWRLHVYRIH